MRNKLRYTIDEITVDLYTAGGQFMTEDNVEYIGAYHRYTTNEIYTGPTWNSKTSVKLITLVKTRTDNVVYRKLKSNLVTKYYLPSATIITITEQQRMTGSITRYFMKKTNDNHVFEINNRTYTLWQSKRIDPLVYLTARIQWQIAGPIGDEIIAGVSKLGVRTKNLNQIKLAESILPGISLLLTNPIELYTDIDFKVPKDINS
tara:strand:- start:1198 stop:1809 length:612 start_codon:yes stop_codon:yes gene_type:complete